MRAFYRDLVPSCRLPRHPYVGSMATTAETSRGELITWLGGVGLLATLQVIEWQAAVARGAYVALMEPPARPPTTRGLEW